MGSNDTISQVTETAGPNWGAVPFEVGCARCGHDLRGLTEPTCPSCELEFDWAVAVPIEQLTCPHCQYHLYGLTETRCPECGGSFTWQVVLDDYHRQQKPLFEYRWRHKPFHSLIKTWWLTFGPSKFWSQIDMHDPPKVKPLISLVCLHIIILHVFIAMIMATSSRLNDWWLQATYNIPPQYRWAVGPPKTFMEIILEWLQLVFNFLLETELLITLAAWVISSYLALLIFQQSMRRYHVRNVHLVRVWVYSFPMIPFMILAVFGSLQFNFAGTYASFAEVLLPIAFFVTIALVVRSIQVAYKQYLIMPHSWAVAVSTQLIAVFTAMTASLIVRWG